MKYSRILWDAEDDPEGNIEHIAEHDLTVEDVEGVLAKPTGEGQSHSTGLPAGWGYTSDGRYIIVVYDEIDRQTIRVVMAYEVPEPKARSKKKRK